jgi:phage terminase large subunit
MSVAACHGPGKTASAAWCIIYSLLFRYPLRAVGTAPSRGQIEGAMMSEISKWIDKLPPELATLLEVKSTSVVLKANPKLSNFEARTARPENPEALQGVHEDEGWVFLLVDEASGVHEKIFESAAGSMSGHNCQTMLLSNPTRTSGFFFRTHNQEKHRWFTVKISHKDSSRVTDDFVEEMAVRYGRDSNTFRVRALGEFPRTDLDTMIPYELVDAARNRDVEVPTHLRTVWALDVARFGDDDTVLLKRNNIGVDPNIQVWNGLDTMAVANRVKLEWDTTIPSQRPTVILVDVIGIGAGVVDRLSELGLPVRGINVSETAAQKEQYRNLRTELGFLGKEWLESRDHILPLCNGSCPDRLTCVHDRLAMELTTIRYDVTTGGKLLMETKKDMKKRGYKSPDIADAFFLSFAEEPSTMVHGSKDGWGEFGWNKTISRGRSYV